MRARQAFAGVVEQGLADHAAEGAELEGVGVVAEGALCRHHARVLRALFSGGSVGAALLVLAAMALARHGARSAAALVGLLVGFHGAHAARGGFRERAERAHGDYVFAGGSLARARGLAGGRLDRAATTATEAEAEAEGRAEPRVSSGGGGWIGARKSNGGCRYRLQSSLDRKSTRLNSSH